MKIAWVSDSTTICGGFGQQVKILGEELHKRGHEIYVLCKQKLPGAPSWANEISFGGRKMDQIDRELHRIRPDAVICLDGHQAEFEMCALNYSGKSKFFLWFPYEASFVPDGYTKFISHAPPGGVVHLSSFTRDLFGLGGPVIPHCVDVDVWSSMMVRDRRVELRIPPDKKIMSNFNRNDPRKRWDVFYAVAAKLPDDWHFLVHTNRNGGFYDFAQLEKFYGLEGRISYADFDLARGHSREDLADIAKLSHVRFDPSAGEGFGLTVVELACAAIPQVVYDHTCMREILPDYPLVPLRGHQYTRQGFLAAPVPDDAVDAVLAAGESVGKWVYDTQLFAREYYAPSRIADLWIEHIEQHNPPRTKWGWNNTATMSQSMLAAAFLAQKIGGRSVEIGAYNSDFASAVKYFGGQSLSVSDWPDWPDHLENTRLSVSGHGRIWPDGQTLVLTDSHLDHCPQSDDDYYAVINQIVKYDWLIVRASDYQHGPPMTQGLWGRGIGMFHRRNEVEAGMKVRFPQFVHQVWSKDPKANPL